MKRRELIEHLTRHGCRFLREGSRHTVYFNSVNRKTSTIPRHNEIHDFLAKKICKDLEIPKP
ncbi:addiction module toxin, HicA family [candidate division WOR-1 bacterium RIFOXYA2_FULL_37_7]|uniref:Addiction module toxin, HicA family n=1 Tax=candidate division WOR-1 bacterium RIFOXYB2_FULL_37_13 TaxID=1802579 RepID=A0A1F4SWA9_UNCSA|nr:MAG: addiction module toxin, HicA family [candidate division WOR-1 bacterium RIFOXYA2_FULL_37_7]OGC24637.1 MAG: addiction module toxin, HicA family [candidate division WOR-1 bacterium RIFOXYB2_FULL_37_13]